MTHAASPVSVSDLGGKEGEELVKRVNSISFGDRALIYELSFLQRQLCGPQTSLVLYD